MLAIYGFIDDLLKKTQTISIDKRRKLSGAQVITTLIISAKYFYGNRHTPCLPYCT